MVGYVDMLCEYYVAAVVMRLHGTKVVVVSQLIMMMVRMVLLMVVFRVLSWGLSVLNCCNKGMLLLEIVV